MLIDRGRNGHRIPYHRGRPSGQLGRTGRAVTRSKLSTDHLYERKRRTVLHGTAAEPGKDLRILKGVNICVVGPETAESLESYGLGPTLSLPNSRLKACSRPGRMNVRGPKFLIPRAKIGAGNPPRQAEGTWSIVTVATAYENVKPTSDVDRVKKLFDREKDQRNHFYEFVDGS